MASGNPDTEVLTEHFGYPPVSLLDEIINSINILADKALTSVETGLLNAPPTSIGFGKPTTSINAKPKRKRKQHPDEEQDDGAASELSPEQIEDQANAEIAAGTHQLETLLCTSIDRNFDKFELYVMRNILCVKPEDRDWIRLGHYDGLNFDNLPENVLPGTKKNSALAGAAGGNDKEKDNHNNNNGNGDKMDTDSSAAPPPTAEDDDAAADDDVNPDIPTITSVNKLRKRLQASQKLNALLAAEKTRNDALLHELRSIAGRTTKAAAAATAHASSEDNNTTATTPPLAFLHNKGDLTQADAATPLTTTTAFALSQMQALRALSTSLSNILPDLQASSDAGIAADAAAATTGEGEGDANKITTPTTTARRTWRKERVEYIEGAARRHLEAVRGLELDEDGEIRDGEWQGEGPRVGAEEFAALEGVLDLLAKNVVSAEGKRNGDDGVMDVDVGDPSNNAGKEGGDDAAKHGAATES